MIAAYYNEHDPVLIYQVTHTSSGKKYIGVTRHSLNRRWRGHVQKALAGARTALAASIRKYGEDAFIVEHIATALNRHVAGEVEAALIVERGTKAPRGYNLTDGGDGVLGLPAEIVARTAALNQGRKHTDAARLKIGLAGRGRKKSKEARAAISAARKGKPLSDEHRHKLSLAKVGTKRPPRSVDHCQRISEGLRRAHARRRARSAAE